MQGSNPARDTRHHRHPSLGCRVLADWQAFVLSVLALIGSTSPLPCHNSTTHAYHPRPQRSALSARRLPFTQRFAFPVAPHSPCLAPTIRAGFTAHIVISLPPPNQSSTLPSPVPLLASLSSLCPSTLNHHPSPPRRTVQVNPQVRMPVQSFIVPFP